MKAPARDFIGVIPERGFIAFLLCFVGLLVLIGWCAAYRRPIDYAASDPKADAMRTFAHGDTRYLASDADPHIVKLPADQQLPENSLDFDRDVRLLPPAGETQLSNAQNAYISSYNATMLILVRGGRAGLPSPRPKPLPRFVFAMELLVVMLPAVLNLYLRYRLGAYRQDGCSWTVDLLHTIRPYLTNTYSAEGQPLLRLLWGTVVLFVPWVLAFLLLFGDRPLQ